MNRRNEARYWSGSSERKGRLKVSWRGTVLNLVTAAQQCFLRPVGKRFVHFSSKHGLKTITQDRVEVVKTGLLLGALAEMLQQEQALTSRRLDQLERQVKSNAA